jgi:hypothetical protein
VGDGQDPARRVEGQRPAGPHHLQVGALRDLGQQALGAVDLTQDERAADADDPRALENLGVASVLLGDRGRAQEAVERLRALDAARAARLARLLAGGG